MNICIVGSNGYIGSALTKNLKYNIVGIDDPMYEYTASFIEAFDVIIYLGGRSSRIMTNYNDNILKITSLMNINQILIYASTSAVYEGCTNATETLDINENDLDDYCKYMLLRESSIKNIPFIRSVGLRLATVVGLSPRQRSDRIHIQMLKDAIFLGRIQVLNPLAKRCIVSMEETIKAISTIIEHHDQIQGHKIYNISSFNTNVSSIASSISRLVEVKLIYNTNSNAKGFSVNNENFKIDFGFEYTSTNESIIKDLWNNKEELLEAWKNPIKTLTCIVCENNNMTEMVNLGNQPLANQFTLKDVVAPAYPLAMYRCTNCYHNQLSHIIPPEELFNDYIYVSGTSKTNDEHFEWISRQIVKDKPYGKVLDIACNDGTQLDKFKSKGWDTYGVDPAKNLYPISSEKGHHVIVGFWGDTEINKLLPDTFDVLIAQNVFAHVPNPKNFLINCRYKMDTNSVLYIQTSQADLFIHGEYDTIYHEHISFFTIKSMLYLSELCGLYLYDVEKVPIHGTSYIFKLKLSLNQEVSKIRFQQVHPNVLKMIDLEKTIYSPYNPIFYKNHVDERRTLIGKMLTKYHEDGYTLIGFGSSAKGNTLLNSLIGVKNLPEYIIDENPLKQHLYTPGTHIPVVPYEKLSGEKRPLAILVLAWNFLEEIKEKIAKVRTTPVKDGPLAPTIILTPFPDTSVLLLRNNKWIKMSEFPICMSLEKKQTETLLITHFYNEEFLLPYWIMHHASMFDHVVLINNGSTDSSCQIIRDLAPSHWQIVNSDAEKFDAYITDQQVRKIEKSYPNHIWKLSLTITEFLVWNDMNKNLLFNNAYKLHGVNITGDDQLPLINHIQLVKQRNQITQTGSDYSRYIHRHFNTVNNLYEIGRHSIYEPSVSAHEAMIFKYIYSPWPEILPRKLQIKDRQSLDDIGRHYGRQHQVSKEQLELLKIESLKLKQFDYYQNSRNGTDNDILRSKALYGHLGEFWYSKL